jgi:predicted nucleic acid-binding protein
MILVDTSVWIDHIRKAEPLLVQLLDNGLVLAHQLVIGELAVGQFKHQDEILERMLEMPQAMMAETFEVLKFIKENALAGIGIGFIDAHLLASVRLTPGTRLWTRDKRLFAASARLGLDAKMAN